MIRCMYCKLTGQKHESYGMSSGMMDACIDFAALGPVVVVVMLCLLFG